MNLKLYFIISIFVSFLVAMPAPYMVFAQDKRMETDEGMVIEETHVKTIKDADGTSPGGILEAPKPEGSLGGESRASAATAKRSYPMRPRSRWMNQIEAIIPSSRSGETSDEERGKSPERKKEITKRKRPGIRPPRSKRRKPWLPIKMMEKGYNTRTVEKKDPLILN